MTEDLAAIRRPFEPADLRPHLAAAAIDATILVQTRASMDETRDFLALAAATDFIAGVVGWIDLTRPDAEAAIAELRALPGGTKLVGIRHQVHDEPDPNWLLRDEVVRGIAAVRDANLTYDFLVRERELPAAIAIARMFADLRCVLDHAAKPPIATGRLPDGWHDGIIALAAQPNVWCKLSGLVTEAGAAWTRAALRPYAAHVTKAFGARRLIFGSDWPVCLLAAPYADVAHVAAALADDLIADDDERTGIFGAHAAAAYELGAPAGA
jgi:L-fuconolactonase